jgi:hypothetical protein
MRTSLVILLSLLSASSFGEPIITDIAKVKSIYEKLRNNPYYLKVGPAKFKINYFDIGRAETPFYEYFSTVKEFYRNENKCFELTVFETINVAKRVTCYDKMKQLFLPGFEEFKVVSVPELISEGLTSFQAEAFSQSFELEASLLAIAGPKIDETAPRSKFKAHLKGLTEIVLSKKEAELELRQALELSVDKIGFLSSKSSSTTNSIKVIPGGHIFSNQKGKVLIYNPVLPKPFGDYELSLNSKLPEMLESLAKESQTAPVCLRDHYVNPGPKDCHRLLFETHALGLISKIKILSIDFVTKKIEFLK